MSIAGYVLITPVLREADLNRLPLLDVTAHSDLVWQLIRIVKRFELIPLLGVWSVLVVCFTLLVIVIHPRI